MGIYERCKKRVNVAFGGLLKDNSAASAVWKGGKCGFRGLTKG